MLIVIRKLISIIVLFLSVYGLFTKNYDQLPLMMILFGVLMLIMGVEEFQGNQKSYKGYLFLVTSLLLFLVCVQGFIY